MLDQNQRIFAEIFRTSSPWNLKTFNRTSGLQDSLALGLQKLQVFGSWRRSSELDRKSTRLNSSHTDIYTLSLHDALPISMEFEDVQQNFWSSGFFGTWSSETSSLRKLETFIRTRSEEHTSELQSH